MADGDAPNGRETVRVQVEYLRRDVEELRGLPRQMEGLSVRVEALDDKLDTVADAVGQSGRDFLEHLGEVRDNERAAIDALREEKNASHKHLHERDDKLEAELNRVRWWLIGIPLTIASVAVGFGVWALQQLGGG